MENENQDDVQVEIREHSDEDFYPEKCPSCGGQEINRHIYKIRTIQDLFPLFSILSFLLIIFLSNFIFRNISRSEIETIESFFNKENKFENVISKGLKIF